MKKTGLWTAAVLAALTAGSAWADRPDHRHHRDHRDGVRFGISIGVPWPAPTYPMQRRYPPHWPHVVMPLVLPTAPVMLATPRVYIEQAPAPAAVPVLEPGYWYYCSEAGAYYPYVQTCPGDWVKVTPQTR